MMFLGSFKKMIRRLFEVQRCRIADIYGVNVVVRQMRTRISYRVCQHSMAMCPGMNQNERCKVESKPSTRRVVSQDGLFVLQTRGTGQRLSSFAEQRDRSAGIVTQRILSRGWLYTGQPLELFVDQSKSYRAWGRGAVQAWARHSTQVGDGKGRRPAPGQKTR